jgi:DNA-binding NarL/FixJ family response regulator
MTEHAPANSTGYRTKGNDSLHNPVGEDQSMSRPRLLIADDHESMRYMFKLLAEAECEVVGEAENGQEAVEAAERLSPDLLLMDVSMPVMGGFEAARLLRERLPELCIILMSQHAQRAYADEALRLGVKGYVLKEASTRSAAGPPRSARRSFIPLLPHSCVAGENGYSPSETPENQVKP